MLLEKFRTGLKFKLLAILITLTLVPLFIAGFLAVRSIEDNISEQARITVQRDVESAQETLQRQVGERETHLSFASENEGLVAAVDERDFEQAVTVINSDRLRFDLDFLTVLDSSGQVLAQSNTGEVETGASFELPGMDEVQRGNRVSGIVILEEEFVRQEGLTEQAAVELDAETEGEAGREERALAIVSMAPVRDQLGRVAGVLVGGELLNHNYEFVDEIGETLEVTCTIFFEDLRVATNVMLNEEERAVGTRAAEDVTRTVLEEGQDFSGRALVVDEYFITAYQPLVSIEEETVGMIYTGISEAPFVAISNANRNRFLLIGAISAVVALGVAFKFCESVTRPLRNITEGMKEVEDGHLNQDISISRSDELGQIGSGFNSMLQGLREMVETVKDMSEKVTASAGDLTSAVQQSNAAMEDIATTANDNVARSAQEIAQNSEQAAEQGKESENAAREGVSAVKEAVGSMEEIDSAVKDISSSIQELNEFSQKITVIIKSITDIAGQTDLLALNAAIEAARAGEQGRGFAVVADEVRKLAEQSEQAAGEVDTLISGIQERITGAVEKMEGVSEVVVKGDEKARSVEQELDRILNSVLELSNYINQIAGGAQDQSAAAQEIAASSQEQTAMLEEINSHATQLAQMAEDLHELVKKFNM